MKKTVLILILALILTGCAGKPEPQSAQIANPWTTWDTLEEGEKAAEFSLDLPGEIAGFSLKTVRTMSGKSPLLEVVYTLEEANVTIRKVHGENQDISGVYGLDQEETLSHGSGTSITLRTGADDPGLLMLLSRDGFSWSVYAPEGLEESLCLTFADAILS